MNPLGKILRGRLPVVNDTRRGNRAFVQQDRHPSPPIQSEVFCYPFTARCARDAKNAEETASFSPVDGKAIVPGFIGSKPATQQTP
jgi:hypothetical protein